MEERAKKAEEKARQLQEKLESNDSLKEELRERFLSELMRRQEVSGTFEETQGVVFPFDEYDAEDPVAVWYNSERDTPADISGEPWDPLYDSEYLKYAMDGCGQYTSGQMLISSQTSNHLIYFQVLMNRPSLMWWLLDATLNAIKFWKNTRLLTDRWEIENESSCLPNDYISAVWNFIEINAHILLLRKQVQHASWSLTSW